MREQLDIDLIALTAKYVFVACLLLTLLLVGLMFYMGFRSAREAREDFTRYMARIRARSATADRSSGTGASREGEQTWVDEALKAVETGSENPTREFCIPPQNRRVTYVLRPGEHPAISPIRPYERMTPPVRGNEDYQPRHLLRESTPDTVVSGNARNNE